MNRHERRAARKHGAVVKIDRCRLLEFDRNYGLPVVCYVCDTPHKALGLARIRDSRSTTDATIDVPLCEPCLVSSDTDNAVIRKFLSAPDLEVFDKGEATTEQIEALTNKQDETEH